MALVNFDLKPSARVLSRSLVISDFSHSFTWRRIGSGWSSDGERDLKTFLTFMDIMMASSRVTGFYSSRLREDYYYDRV